jgi:hypothetical protein
VWQPVLVAVALWAGWSTSVEAQAAARSGSHATKQPKQRQRATAQSVTNAAVPRSGSHATKKRSASRARADPHLVRGIAEYKNAQYAAAILELQAVTRPESTPLALFYLGRCHDDLGDATAAADDYVAFLANASKPMQSLAEFATERLELLRAMPGKIDVSSKPSGAEIQVDGHAGAGRTPARIELAPGEHTIRVSAADRMPEERQIEIPFASSTSVEFELKQAANQPVATATPAATVSPPEPGELPPRPALRAVRAKQPPKIDGILDDLEWQRVEPIAAFTQKAPFGGRAPTEKTTLRLLYDDDSVYVAFDCEQLHSSVVALLARRDRPTESDSVSIALDSRSEGRSAFEFSVSAAGVLVDGMRFDDGKIAREWDEIWEAKTELHAHGWSAEFRIPLQALRFEPAPNQSWGFQARRYISAKQEADEWAYIPLDTGGEVSHYGRIEELRDLHHASLELQPFLLGRARYQAPDPAIASSGWNLRPSGGLDFKWHPTGNVALNGTINPDFGQVEADQLILNLSTVELVFPEKRPFFLAGMDDFATLTPIFYSRRIGRTQKTPTRSTVPLPTELLYDYPQPAPIYGALKLAGDLSGGWNIAALSAVTGPNEVDFALPDGARDPRLLDPLTSYNVLRVRTELVPRLDLGVIATATTRAEPGIGGLPLWLTSSPYYPELPASGTDVPTLQRCPQGETSRIGDRCFHDAYVGSVDFVWKSPSGEYAIRGQGTGSAIANGPTRTLPDGTVIGSGDLGAGGTLRLSKQGGEHWVVDGTLAAQSRKLDFNDLGFMQRQNDARAGAYAEYRTLEPWFLFIETHTSLLAYGQNNLDGLALARGALLMENLVLASRWALTLGGYASAAHFDDREVGDGTALQRAALLGLVQSVSTDTRRALIVSAQVAEERLEDGANFNVQVGATWHPMSMLELQLVPSYTYNFGEPRYAGTGQAPTDLVFGRLRADSASVTLHASYTFFPALTLQTYAQTFLASGHYFEYTHLLAPAAGPRPIVRLSDLVPGAAPATAADFERVSLALNVVLRWEYHLGSTLYLLYVRSQNPNIALQPLQTPRLDPLAIRTAPATDVLMLKIAYWIG